MEVRCGKAIKAGRLFGIHTILLDGAKQILGCSSKTCNEAIKKRHGLRHVAELQR